MELEFDSDTESNTNVGDEDVKYAQALLAEIASKENDGVEVNDNVPIGGKTEL